MFADQNIIGEMEKILAEVCGDDRDAHQRQVIAQFCRMLEGSFLHLSQQDLPAVRIVAGFSPRVRQTLQRLLVGDSEKQIARRLGVSQNTVHVYIKAIYRSFDVGSRGELMTHFISDRWREIVVDSVAVHATRNIT